MVGNNKSAGHTLLEKISMKDDPLQFLLFPIYFNMSRHATCINIVKGLIILYLQTFNVIGIVQICKDETRTYLQQYMSVICAQQIGIVCYVLHMCYAQKIFQFSNQIKLFFLPTDIAGTKVEKKIMRQCSLVRKIFVFLFILLTATFFTSLPLVGDEEDIEFAVIFIRKHFVWPTFFQGVYYLCFSSLGYSIAVLCSIGIYLTVHLKFQFYLLSEYLRQISYGYRPSNDDRTYQDIIHRRLSWFIRAHNNIKKVIPITSDISKWSVLGTAAGTSFLYAALAYYIVAGVSPLSNFRFIIAMVTSAIVTYIVTKHGQDLQDESVHLYNAAYQCEWVHWNVQNRRALLMIIINTSKVVKLSSFGMVDLGYELILRMLKISYSTVLLFVNVNK